MSVVLPGGLKVYSCADWGACPPAHAFAATTPTNMVVHHMDYPNRPLISSPAAQVKAGFALARRCQNDHMDHNGWADTGQHFTISRDGIVLEGRHGSLGALLQGHCIRGAHAADSATGADDNNSWGVEHEGNYMSAQMPAAQWNASVKLYAAMAYLCHLDTALIIGHRDTGCQTACPGDALEKRLLRMRAAAHELKLHLLAAKH